MSSTNHSLSYRRVASIFVRNALVRDMSFRGNFVITVFTRLFWFAAQLTLFEVIYRHVDSIRDWSRWEYFAFMATYMLIFSIVEAFFLPNAIAFGERIRTGELDFVLVKPIDPQFLISLERVDLAVLSNSVFATCVLAFSVVKLGVTPGFLDVLIYAGLVVTAVAFFYSLMIALSAASVFMGRNTGLQEFWFYITIFGRYPQGFFRQAGLGESLVVGLSYVIPLLLVVTVPARLLLGKLLYPSGWILLVAPALTLVVAFVSRRVFLWSLTRYSSASS